MRFALAAVVTVGCAAAGEMPPNGAVDAPPPDDPCVDTDMDGACNFEDQCPGEDDRVDVNTNGTPDCREAMTRMVDLKMVGTNHWRGWQASATSHATLNDNTLTGSFDTSLYNSYFVFSLAGFSATAITSVTLELQMDAYQSTATSEAISIWDVTTAAMSVETATIDAAIFQDLQTGNKYGMTTATSTQINDVLSIPLSMQAATDVRAKLGMDFVVAVHLDGPQGWIRFGNTPIGGTPPPPMVNRLVIKYIQ